MLFFWKGTCYFFGREQGNRGEIFKGTREQVPSLGDPPQGSWDLLNLHHPNFTDENNWSLIGISLYIPFYCFPPSINSLCSPIIYA